MSKIMWKAGTKLYPVPPALVTCGTMEEPNIITIAWTGIVNSEPPMTYVSVRPSRFSHKLIKDSEEFVINLPSENLLKAVDYCGIKSGSKYNKFKDMELTPKSPKYNGCIERRNGSFRYEFYQTINDSYDLLSLRRLII